jgi:hypothetical protein
MSKARIGGSTSCSRRPSTGTDRRAHAILPLAAASGNVSQQRRRDLLHEANLQDGAITTSDDVRMTSASKERMLYAGLKHAAAPWHNDLGIQTVLTVTGLPKGSFYHHFDSK